jgi:hypothetical protein
MPMRLVLQLILMLFAGLALGLGVGYLAIGRASAPPTTLPASELPLAPPVSTHALAPALPDAATPSDEEPPPPQLAHVAPSPMQAGLVPVPPASAHKLDVDPSEISLVPRGPGHFAWLDLRAAGIPSVTVRQGILTRDGAANWANFANKPKVALLKGPSVRVELLHLGFDAEARPIVAHVRTTGHAGGEVEGIVPLKIGEVFLPVRADLDSPPPPRPAPVPLRPAVAPAPATP